MAAFFDVDGTLVAGQAIWRGITAYHFATRRRRGRVVSFYLGNLWPIVRYKTGNLSRDRFVAGWGERLAGLFAGLSPQQAQAVYDWVWENTLRPSLRADVVERLQAHSRAGHLVVLVSATLHGLVETVAARLGADLAAGSQLKLQAGRYTGRISPPLCFGPHKASHARAVAEDSSVDLAASFAYADSGHDAPLLEAVGHPVAVCPDPILFALARRRGWPVLGTPQK